MESFKLPKNSYFWIKKFLPIFSKNMLDFHVVFFCALNRVWVLNSRRNLGFKNLKQIFSEKQSYFCPFQTLTCLLKAEFPTEPIAHFSLEQISKYLGSKNNYSESIEKSIRKWIENREVRKCLSNYNFEIIITLKNFESLVTLKVL